MTNEERLQVNFYKFIQPILSSLTTVAVITLATFLNKLNTNMAVIQTEVKSIKEDVHEMRSKYVSKDVFQSHEREWERRIMNVESRIRVVSGN
ncbi:MAG: hypothetical protein HWD92_08860 [Flavobacteriia bacterium]|nr:hypothetical protein [Flavobacteriia bacterium]